MTTQIIQTALKGKDLIDNDLFPTGERDSLVIPVGGKRVEVARGYISDLPVEMPHDVRVRMDQISQVTFKDLWIGRKDVMHSRWKHAIGTYNIGMVWYKVLCDDNRIPKKVITPGNNELTGIIAGYAMLLHDYGHVSFCHLLEETLRGINWFPVKEDIYALEDSSLRMKLNQRSDPVLPILHRVFKDFGIDDIEPLVRHVFALIEGTSGFRWLQSMVNGPVDADKMDYLRRDHELLLNTGYPITTRLNMKMDGLGNVPWLTEFLSEQFVNHAGYLCLPGRSALAAADLWRERIFLYDRFYLSPSIRVADRIVVEILQQFLIRSVMSRVFSYKISTKDSYRKKKISPAFQTRPFEPLANRMQTHPENRDMREIKYEACLELIITLMDVFGYSPLDDFDLLEFMADMLEEWVPLDEGYRKLMKGLWGDLKTLSQGNRGDYRVFAESHIVQQPLSFPKARSEEVRHIIRSLQHQFAADVLIDVVTLPSVLSDPLSQIPRRGGLMNGFTGILVPKGKVSNWGFGSTDFEPLVSSKVQELEMPFGRIIVISRDVGSARSKYVFDRVIGTLRQADITVEEVSL